MTRPLPTLRQKRALKTVTKRAKRKRYYEAHERHVKRHTCAVQGPDCGGPIDAHHMVADFPEGTPDWERNGASIKSHSKWCAPLCRDHHTGGPNAYHRIGHDTFEAMFDVKLNLVALKMQSLSPARATWERNERDSDV